MQLDTSPGKYTYASSGVGSTLHITAEHFIKAAGLQVRHVPYRGEAPAVQDLPAGHVPFMVGAPSFAEPYVKSGKLAGLGVTTPKRLASMPSIPTIDEELPGFSAFGWNVILAPKNTPRPVIDLLNREINATTGQS